MSKDKQDYHNKGQSDHADGKYDSPRFGAASEFVASNSEIEKNQEDTQAYHDGWNNASKQ